MSFVEMTAEEWDAVYKHHDALVRMAELELKADRIRTSCVGKGQTPMLEPIEDQMDALDRVIASLPA